MKHVAASFLSQYYVWIYFEIFKLKSYTN